jgi:integrase
VQGRFVLEVGVWKDLGPRSSRTPAKVPLSSMGEDKTASGTGRVIALSQRAMATLRFWAAHFPERRPEHYVFPAERYGAGGDQFCAKAYDIDPSRPIGSIKEAWETAKLRAGRILKGFLGDVQPEKDVPAVVCWFHDLRHTAVSRMLNAGVPIAKVAKIAGWSPATMVRMAARCGHFSLNELRGAVENISGKKTHPESPVFSPVAEGSSEKGRAN